MIWAKIFKFFSLALGLALVFGPSATVWAAVASSPHYQMEFDSLNFGGGYSNSTNYTMQDTGGEVGTGYSNSANNTIHAGYQQSSPVSSVPGCTDPNANNYNSSATINDGSCTYGHNGGGGNPPSCEAINVSNFSAAYQTSNKQVNLNWVNSNSGTSTLDEIIVVRQAGAIPNNQTDGQIIYQGTGQSSIDAAITAGVTYFYAAFARFTLTNTDCWSSGAIASASIPPAKCVGIDCFPPCEETKTCVATSTTGEIIIKQPGLPDQIFHNGSELQIQGDLPVMIWMDVGRAPPGLKTILVTLIDPNNPKLSLAFLLRLNDAGTAYTAIVGPLHRGGFYPTKINILDYDNQRLEGIQGKLYIASAALLPLLPPLIIPPVLVPPPAVTHTVLSGLAITGLVPVLVSLTQITSVYELILALWGWLNGLLALVGLRKRRPPWGVVYDAVTKRPIDPALVTVWQGERQVASAITDLDGRYGFILPTGVYTIRAGKNHYRFPSQVLAGRSHDEVYDNLYFGGPVEAEPVAPITRNIPLDPLNFDWNEYVKRRADLFRFYSQRELTIRRVLNTIFYCGFALASLNLLWWPGKGNLAVVVIYCLILVISLWRSWKYKLVRVRRASGGVVPYALVRVYLAGLNQEIKTVVTDDRGRFYLLLRPGIYTLAVEEKQSDGSYHRLYQSLPLDIKSGILDHDLIV